MFSQCIFPNWIHLRFLKGQSTCNITIPKTRHISLGEWFQIFDGHRWCASPVLLSHILEKRKGEGIWCILRNYLNSDFKKSFWNVNVWKLCKISTIYQSLTVSQYLQVYVLCKKSLIVYNVVASEGTRHDDKDIPHCACELVRSPID